MGAPYARRRRPSMSGGLSVCRGPAVLECGAMPPTADLPRSPRPTLRDLWRDASGSAVVAGFVAVVVGAASSIGLLVGAARDFGLTPGQTASWVLACYLAISVSGGWLSWQYRAPIKMAWSTPGLALVASLAAAGDLRYPEVLGAYVLTAGVMTALGWSGAFERLTSRIPAALANALLAGVLLPFVLGAFRALPQAPVPVGGMLLVFLAGRVWFSRWAVPAALLAGAGLSLAVGAVGPLTGGGLGTLVWTTPEFSLRGAVTLALPLTILTLASQQLPGVAVLRACGYGRVPTSPLITGSGLASLLSAPFGAHTTNLAAITAAIAAGEEAHPDPARRWVAGLSAAFFYLMLGVFAGWVVGAVAAVPPPVIAALAGLALVTTTLSSLTAALEGDYGREAAFLTLAVTASGVTLLGVGSAVWGLVLGGAVLWVKGRR
ncbi:benzoate membrane transport protein [Deinococcus sp. HSC-46F16]|uniref:benzoate/H(+) symporter BenE family transporter n=1 Tax=Deinococcus sp. HSC-46F16 TaxID=2910968 RepID=UPI00209C81D8|nr:benzoate/H(+) symporter BenE family transporter [Deinococcus sp. HSC-46F16]MCP2013701.1 benzoate membrane transport protein [Deinococcus sp. HSC-46F16]